MSQGDPAQVVIGGKIAYKFDDALTTTAGIFSLPSTRSTAQSFPNWLRIDHRSMADEYFRGSYIQGYMASGELTDTLDYKVALAGNLSALGVRAASWITVCVRSLACFTGCRPPASMARERLRRLRVSREACDAIGGPFHLQP